MRCKLRLNLHCMLTKTMQDPFFGRLDSDCMGNHTYAMRFLHHLVVHTVIRSGGRVINFALTLAAVRTQVTCDARTGIALVPAPHICEPRLTVVQSVSLAKVDLSFGWMAARVLFPHNSTNMMGRGAERGTFCPISDARSKHLLHSLRWDY